MADLSVHSFTRTDTALDTLSQVAEERGKTGYIDKKGNIAGGTISVANKSGNRDQSAVLDKVLSNLQKDINDLVKTSGGSESDSARLHQYVLKTANEELGPLEAPARGKLGNRGDKTLQKLDIILDIAVGAVKGFKQLFAAEHAPSARKELPVDQQSEKSKANLVLARQIEDLSDEITEKRSEVDRILSTPEAERNRYDDILLSNWQRDLPSLESKLAALEAKHAKATREVQLPKGDVAEYRHTQELEGNHYQYTVSSFEDQSVAASNINVGRWGDLESDQAVFEANPDLVDGDAIKDVEYDYVAPPSTDEAKSLQTLQNFDDDWEIGFADDPSYEVIVKNPGRKDEYTEVTFTEDVVGTKRSVINAWRDVIESQRDQLKAKINEAAPPQIAAAIITDLEVTWRR